MEQRSAYIEMTSAVVVAYVAHNHVSVADLPALIARVHESLLGLRAAWPSRRRRRLRP